MKTPKVKKREVSIHSRAARRGAPLLSNDLAVKAPAAGETEYKPWLHSVQNGGVGKKKKEKQVSRQQRLRQQKALEKADKTVHKLEKKVADSKARSKKIQARRKEWDELNNALAGNDKSATEQSSKPDEPAKAGREDVSKLMEDVQMRELKQSLLTRAPDAEPDNILTEPHNESRESQIEDEIS